MRFIKKHLPLTLFLMLLADVAPAQTFLQEFDTADQAQQNCPYDKVVWVDNKKAIQRYKAAPPPSVKGGYVCRQQAINAGYGGLVTHLQPLKKP